MTAMTAATIDTLSGGRFRLGLGVSGPQVSEGWHGVRFADPLGRTREYVEIVRSALRRETVSHAGKHFTLPLPDGPGKALKPHGAPRPGPDADLPRRGGPKNLELSGEIADGWLAIFFSPEHSGDLLGSIATGRRRAGHAGDDAAVLDGFDVVPTVPVVVADDVAAAADAVRAYCALYIGGMGSREKNFYNQLACRMGFEDAAARDPGPLPRPRAPGGGRGRPARVHRRDGPARPRERIAERVARYADAGVTTLSISTFAPTLETRLDIVRTMAELARPRPGLGALPAEWRLGAARRLPTPHLKVE